MNTGPRQPAEGRPAREQLRESSACKDGESRALSSPPDPGAPVMPLPLWLCSSFSEGQTPAFPSLHRVLSGHGKSVRLAAAPASASHPGTRAAESPSVLHTGAHGKATAVRNEEVLRARGNQGAGGHFCGPES